MSDKWDPESTPSGEPVTGYDHLAEIPAGWLDEAEQVLEGSQQIIGEHSLTSKPTVALPQPVAPQLQPPQPTTETKAPPNKVQVVWYTKDNLPGDVEMLQEFSNGRWVVTYENRRTQQLSARELVEGLLHEKYAPPKRTVQRTPPPAPAPVQRTRRVVEEEKFEEELPDVDRDLLDTLGEIMEGWGRRKDGKK